MWPFTSDAGGVTSVSACPCLSSPDSDFLLVLPIIGNWGGRSREQVVSEGSVKMEKARVRA